MSEFALCFHLAAATRRESFVDDFLLHSGGLEGRSATKQCRCRSVNLLSRRVLSNSSTASFLCLWHSNLIDLLLVTLSASSLCHSLVKTLKYLYLVL